MINNVKMNPSARFNESNRPPDNKQNTAINIAATASSSTGAYDKAEISKHAINSAQNPVTIAKVLGISEDDYVRLQADRAEEMKKSAPLPEVKPEVDITVDNNEAGELSPLLVV